MQTPSPPPLRVALIGAGNVGSALGRGWSRAGHAITYGVPDPDAPKHAAAAAGAGGALVCDVRRACDGADVIVLAVPWDAVQAALAACGDLSGRVVMDVTNPLRMGADGLELALGFDRSGAETLAGWAPQAQVIKAMNQVGAAVMDAAHGYPTAPTMFVAGAESEGLDRVMRLVADLGFDARHAGPLSLARLLEPYAMLWIHQVLSGRAPPDAAFALMSRLASGPRP